MHFSKTGIVASFVSLALAANHIPVTIENLDPDFDIKCNGVTVTGRDVYNSVAWGMSLNLNNEQLESSTKSTAMHVQTHFFLLTVQQNIVTPATTATLISWNGYQRSAIRTREQLASTCPSKREDTLSKAESQDHTVPSTVSIPMNEPYCLSETSANDLIHRL